MTINTQSSDRKSGRTGATAAIASAALAVGGIAIGAAIARRRAASTDDAPERSRKNLPGGNALVGRTVTIGRSREELHGFWEKIENLSEVMENVERIERNAETDIWHIRAPGGTTVQVETRITENVPGERIAWESVEGSSIDTRGEVTFRDAPGDRGTRVTLVMSYDPPAGALGRTVAKLFRREPEVQARHDLKRFKMLMETGEIATSAHRRDRTRAAQQETE